MIELIDCIGEPSAIIIINKFSGIFVRVPLNATEHCQLTQLIGIDDAQKMIKTYGGSRLEIPLCRRAMRQLIESEIYAKFESGVSNIALAREYNYTDRGMRNLRRRYRQQQQIDNPQDDLFN